MGKRHMRDVRRLAIVAGAALIAIPAGAMAQAGDPADHGHRGGGGERGGFQRGAAPAQPAPAPVQPAAAPVQAQPPAQPAAQAQAAQPYRNYARGFQGGNAYAGRPNGNYTGNPQYQRPAAAAPDANQPRGNYARDNSRGGYNSSGNYPANTYQNRKVGNPGNFNGQRGNSGFQGQSFRGGPPAGYGNWSHNWRGDNRYDWRGYRDQNRDLFHIGRYYAPYRGYSYSRLGIGFSLDPVFWGSSYWIYDPWQYRLPAAYGPYHWVRYYGDVLLIDTRNGQVVDAIYDFFD